VVAQDVVGVGADAPALSVGLDTGDPCSGSHIGAMPNQELA
jgi:hypothetical protein